MILTACSTSVRSATSTASIAATPAPGATPSATSSTGFAKEATSPDPNFDTGFTIQITAAGFHPKWLISPCCSAITWRNMTNAPVGLVFAAVVGGSLKPIPPGGTYVFVPQNVESVAYHSGSNPALAGVIQVNQLPQ